MDRARRITPMRRLAAFSLLAVMVLGGCSLLGIGRVSRPAQRTLPPAQPAQITVSNQTTLDLILFVNGSQVGPVSGGAQRTFQSGTLPSLPWSVEARTITGRVIGSFDAKESDLQPTLTGREGVQWTIPGTRVDLSCGVLKIWVGNNAISGPIPGPGTPGDCDP